MLKKKINIVKDGMNAIRMIITTAKEVGDGSIEEYFNDFKGPDGGLYDVISDITENHNRQIEDNVIYVLFGIKAALESDNNCKEFFDGVHCKGYVKGASLPKLIDSILKERNIENCRILKANDSTYIAPLRSR